MSKFPLRWRLLAALAIAGIVTLLRAGNDDPEEPAEDTAESGSIVSDCPPGEGLEGALCGTLEVPEDRSNPDGRQIAL
ncbi:MAG: hypothetical protein OXE58_01325, partial [Acidobacteria bacterium]|nr:hypothetical protein [Acidobacteriota bacterium]